MRALRRFWIPAAGALMLAAAVGLSPAKAGFSFDYAMPAEWIGISQSDSDPAEFTLRGIRITAQEDQQITGHFAPSPASIRLVQGEFPTDPSLPGGDAIMPFEGTVAASGEWTAVAPKADGTPHAVLHGWLSSFSDPLLFSDGTLGIQSQNGFRGALALLQTYPTDPNYPVDPTYPVDPSYPVDPHLPAVQLGYAQFGSFDIGDVEQVPLSLSVGAQGQAARMFAASGLYGDMPFLLVGTFVPPNPTVPPNPVVPPNPIRALALGPGLRGVLEAAYTVDDDNQITGFDGSIQIQIGDGSVRTGQFSVDVPPPVVIDQ